MSSDQAILRTQAPSLIAAGYLKTPFSAFVPTAPSKSKGHVRQIIETNPSPSNFNVGVSVRFQVQRDIDVMTMGVFRFIASGIPTAAWGGGATFARWVDFVGLAAWTECKVKSGTQLLQTIKPEEIMISLMKLQDNEHRRNLGRLMGQGTPTERAASSLADQEILVPFVTTLGLNIHGDLSQSLYVRGLNDLLTFEFQMQAANKLIESDAAIPAEASVTGAQYLRDGQLLVEGFHLTRSERALLANYYKSNAFSIHFKDQQYATQIQILGAAQLPSSQPFNISNISQPVQALFFLFRWKEDLGRVTNGTGGTRGHSLFNLAGWWNPGGGATNEIVDTIQIKSGNTDILKATSARRLVLYQHERDFKGDMGVAIPGVSFSHDPTMPNACLGFVSFDQIEQPRVTFAMRAPTLGTAHATVNAAATADIGQNSDLYCDIVGFTAMQMDVANFLLSRPFN